MFDEDFGNSLKVTDKFQALGKWIIFPQNRLQAIFWHMAPYLFTLQSISYKASHST
jgi:hypothetical protein